MPFSLLYHEALFFFFFIFSVSATVLYLGWMTFGRMEENHGFTEKVKHPGLDKKNINDELSHGLLQRF